MLSSKDWNRIVYISSVQMDESTLVAEVQSESADVEKSQMTDFKENLSLWRAQTRISFSHRRSNGRYFELILEQIVFICHAKATLNKKN